MKYNFRALFEPGSDPYKWPDTVDYKGKTIFLSDKFSVKNKEKLIFSIENTNSQYVQGFCVSIYDGYLKINDDFMPKRKRTTVLFWEDSEVLDIKHIEVQVFTKKGYIFIKNLWEIDVYEEERIVNGKEKIVKFPEGKKVPCYFNNDEWIKGRGNGAAMYSEDIPNGKRYFCNDGDEDDDFDDIVFTVRRVAST